MTLRCRPARVAAASPRWNMKVLQIHNRYRVRGGEDSAVDALVVLLRGRGVALVERYGDSREVARSLRARTRAFFDGIYSRSSRADLARVLRRERPDVVHVHNIYPLFSPSVLLECRRNGVPVVMSCHNYRMMCPISVLFTRGEVCEQCAEAGLHRCVARNCRDSRLESLAYALRNYVAAKSGWFRDSVDVFVTPTDFVRRKLGDNGYGDCDFRVVPHVVPAPASPPDRAAGGGRYVAYAGRVSPEKGVQVLVAAARRCGNIPIRVAGDFSAMPELPSHAGGNVQFLGPLDRAQLADFYAGARFMVAPSVCFETFGLAPAEAMGYCLPVIASRIGGLPEVVRDGETGLLAEPGDADDLAAKMQALWADEELCRRMGRAGREAVLANYSGDAIFPRMMEAYQASIDACRRRRH